MKFTKGLPLITLCSWTLTVISAEVIYVKLVDGDGRSTGRVEVARNATSDWGSVCDDLWTDREAQVVCRQLGFQWGTAYPHAAFGQGSGKIYLDNVQCLGAEGSLGDCKHNGWGVHNCRHYEDAGVACYNSSVRLKSRGRTDVGRVEIRTQDGWVEVCDTEWDDPDAKVLCREMGYKDGKAMCCSALGEVQPIVMDAKSFTNFDCKGQERHLANCSHTTKMSRCGNSHLASAICYNVTLDQVDNSFQVKLVHGADNWGEVNVRHLGVWGQVCSSGTNWNDAAANILCKQLGFMGGVAYGTVNETFKPIWANSLNCSGSETSLEQCVQEPWGRPLYACKPAYALCYRQGIQVKLAQGGDYYGRVEITYDGQTGTVCDSAWSDSDARVVCKHLGYADGDPISGSYYGSGTGEALMDGLGCYGYEKSLLRCRNKGWNVYKNRQCNGHKNDASVVCYKDVRLSRGDHSHGVVQIMERYWSVLCGDGFDDVDARVICTQLGFKHGRTMPPGSFGKFYGRYVRPNVNCTGKEASILNCTFDEFRGCQNYQSYLGYAAVSCYNGALTKEQQLWLEDESSGYANQTGRVVVKKDGILGRVCPNTWDDMDADVVCRQLGFRGGVAYRLSSSGRGPYLLGEVNCHGNETSLFHCNVRHRECDSQLASGDAGVLCFRSRRPSLQLVGSSSNSGRIEVVMDSEVGFICDSGWSRYDAAVACRQLGFTDGEPRSGLRSSGTPAVMTAMHCYGPESSLFMCKNPGWKQMIDATCLRGDRNAGVFCYNYVRISDGQSEENTTAGKVEMYHHGSWVTVCGEQFDDLDAKVVCKELGYPYSKALVPGAFGRKYYTGSVTGMNCTGSEPSIKDCKLKDETCKRHSSNYASVLCSKFPVNQADVDVMEPGEFPAPVIVSKFGMNGTICAQGWDDRDAKVVCRQLGYSGGAAFGARYYSSRQPIWMANVSCKGDETSLSQCGYDETPNAECLSNHMAARVLCFRGSGFKVRLAGADSDYFGRVEIAYNGVWGTICDSNWSNEDARVVCKQLGFLDGVAQTPSTYGSGIGPSWLYYVRCDGNEESIWACRNSGWNVTHLYCRRHSYDAGVFCTGRVRLEPNTTYGAVEVWQKEADGYGLVCADEFDDVDAQVVCRSLGYQHGVSICCSAFGKLLYPIIMTNLRCTGREMTILDCDHDLTQSRCPSDKYASVACSNIPPTGAYEFKLPYDNQGSLQVRHLDIWGYICSDGFDDKDAMVVCRELGFSGGFSYYNYEYRRGPITDVPWLSNISCTGNEAYLARCPNVRWGYIPTCSTNSDAAVYCYNNKSTEIRLVNGTSHLSGRVEISIDGVWGTVCGLTYWDDADATVLCRQLNHTSGRALQDGHFGTGSGPTWISYVRCEGNEKSLFHCPVKVRQQGDRTFKEQDISVRLLLRGGGNYACYSHKFDAAVQCYDTVRLLDSRELNYGRVEMMAANQWRAVCDVGFDDTAARVLCRELGYVDGKKQCCSALGEIARSNITITKLKCVGTEPSLHECLYDVNTCSSGQYVSVYCNSTPIVTNKLQIRVQEKQYYGSLEANRYGFWGPICHMDWDDTDAQVACRQLGYRSGVAFNGTTRLDTPMVLGRFQCTGEEELLSSCGYAAFGDDLGCSFTISTSYSRPTAGVLCYNHDEGVSFRLVGSRSRGRVEVKFNGDWGRVCNGSWDDIDAGVLCRQMGFVDGITTASDTRSESSKRGHVWMNFVMCQGSERSLLQCRNTWNPGYAKCQDAEVICYDSVRLVHGDKTSHGAVEVNIRGAWGAVCNHNWQQLDIGVACQQLGFDDGISVCCGAYGYSRLKGFMDNVGCTGKEKQLVNCTHGIPFGGSCSLDYAAVACYNKPKATAYSLSLASGSNSTGVVTLRYMNITGRICADNWDDRDANVVCRELGYSRGQAYTHYKWGTSRGDGLPFWTSQVNCTGNEKSLKECERIPWGNVRECRTGHYAGILCYEDIGVYFRLLGGGRNFGRVEVSVDGKWGSLCNRYWDANDATAFCRSLGFTAGFPYYSDKFKGSEGPVYTANLHCDGNETSLNECPHEGWKPAEKGSSCFSHRMDAAAYCYMTVKLASGVGTDVKHGPVLYFKDNRWVSVCDRGFTDESAKVVCQELGFIDGRAICCSAYSDIYQEMLLNHTLSCTGHEDSVADCLKPGLCNSSDSYASVVCFNETDKISEDYKFEMPKPSKDRTGQVIVSHYGVKGRICSNLWDDIDSRVFCRSHGFANGIAYQHSSDDFVPLSERGPYWISSLNCTGNEPSLRNCSFNSRMSLGDCKLANIASVLCYNESGIQYRMSGGGQNHGRVELALNGVWGSICDTSWDNNDAAVFCRQMHFTDGYALPKAYFGEGKGPVWLSRLQCKGTETALHQCPHRGFSSNVVEGGTGWWKCRSHKDDASVFCIDRIRLNLGFNVSMGAVEIYHDNTWKTVCDDDFKAADARVVCRTLGFVDGKDINGSAFGNVSSPLGVGSGHCHGDESDFFRCNLKWTPACISQTYASVYCSNTSIIDTGFKIRITRDDSDSVFHGHVDVQMGGVWGSICMDTWNDLGANVACRELGFEGGSAYLPKKPVKRPIFLYDVKCSGTESSIKDCVLQRWKGDTNCDFTSQRAGVLCHTKQPIEYRLAGADDARMGRVELRYDGVWGGICDWLWDSHDAKVFCKTIGYQDGLELVGARYGHTDGPLWFTRIACEGPEKNLLKCPNSGFNSSDTKERVYASLCRARSHDAAARCYHKKLEITNVRLANGGPNYGRLEVFLRGPDQWGTVCDDYWDDRDADVVCRQLGFSGGVSKKRGAFGRGSGPIWLDNVGCLGNESKLQDCKHNGFSVQNCHHGEDASVLCNGNFTVTSSGTEITHKLTGNENITAAIVVPLVFIALCAMIALGIFVYKWTRPKGEEINKVLVHNEESDASNIASNPTGDSQVTLSKLKAHFSKGKNRSQMNGVESDAQGISNPVYDDTKGERNSIPEMKVEQPLPAGSS